MAVEVVHPHTPGEKRLRTQWSLALVIWSPWHAETWISTMLHEVCMSVASTVFCNIDPVWLGVAWLKASLCVCRHIYRLGNQLVQSKRWSPREGATEVGWWRQQWRELWSRYRCSELKNNMLWNFPRILKEKYCEPHNNTSNASQNQSLFINKLWLYN